MKTAYFNGCIYTGQLPMAEAFLEENGYFTKVGSNEEIAATEADCKVDLQGRFVCAGFNDSHMHLLNLGQALSVAPLHLYTRSLQEMILCLQ